VRLEQAARETSGRFKVQMTSVTALLAAALGCSDETSQDGTHAARISHGVANQHAASDDQTMT
jgi:hypothetical protein